MDNTGKQRLALMALWALGLLLLAVTLTAVVAFGPLRIVLENEATAFMLAETVLLFLWSCFWLLRQTSGKKRAAALGLEILIFTWCHQILLPLMVSGAYLFMLACFGIWIWGLLFRDIKLSPVWKWLMGLVLGSAAWMVLVCVISLTGRGGLWLWRFLALGIGLWLLLLFFFYWKRQGKISGSWRESLKTAENRFPKDKASALLIAFILTVLLVQAGRINIELDYDSLHYGLRSPYVLDNGFGIYENLGMINLVYTYSKGLEVLCLPLSGTPTYGFVLCVSYWACVLSLALIGYLAAGRGGRKTGLWAAALASAIPGITNMGITAKNDMITLLHQLIIYGLLQQAILAGGMRGSNAWNTEKGESAGYKTGSQAPWLFMAVAVYLLTLVYKPTALVFSTALGGVGLLFLIVRRRLPKVKARDFAVLLLPGAAVAGLWYRTWLFTGVPMTSIFASIFERAGFEIKYPYNFTHVIGDPSLLTLGEKLERLGKRLLGMLAAPVGADMAHVIIAWGTALVTLLLILWPLAAKKSKDELDKFDCVLLPVLALGSVFSIYTLYQVDGNYFILLYALLVVSTVGMIGKKWDLSENHSLRKGLCGLAAPVMACSLFLTCLTSWAGTPGFTPVKLIHRGYCDHRKAELAYHQWKGCSELEKLLTPRSRVLSFGYHPDALRLDACVQSYHDVTGSGGNVQLVKTLDMFKEFLKYAGIEYFYLEAGYLTDNPRALELVEYMIEEGTLTDLVYEYGNALGRVELTGQPSEETEAALREFKELYCVFNRGEYHG